MQRQSARRIRGDSQWVRAVQLQKRQIVTVPINRRVPLTKQQPINVKKRKKSNKNIWWIAAIVAILGIFAFMAFSVILFFALTYGRGILPGVHVAGIDVGGMSQEEAITTINQQWKIITLRDGENTWTVDAQSLGISLDATATVNRAYEQGRGEGSVFDALGGVDVAPVFSVDYQTLEEQLPILADTIKVAPKDANIQIVNGEIQQVPAEYGRIMDISATTQAIMNASLADGIIDLKMTDVEPTYFDANTLVVEANTLMMNVVEIQAHDPRTGDTVVWTLEPRAWGTWLTVVGRSLALDDAAIKDFLTAQATIFDETRYLNIDEAVITIKDSILNYEFSPYIRVYHHDRQHTVKAGESITSIAWDYGVPYPWLQQVNSDIGNFDVGYVMTIPSVDNFLELPVVYNKRIEVSISEQRTRVYENGQLKWDWPSSTGINSSPTWNGVYQILTHEQNAYAGNWDLWMPYFMGVYKPIPDSDFTNGFHGFPTRGGGQLLWENSIGTRVTYGCILLSDTNVSQLYNWAENGVIVEIKP